MKLTVLEIVQRTLSSLSSDEVNSISDTLESLQVSDIVRDEYYDMIDSRDWAQLKSLSALEGLSDSSKPTHMILPEDVGELHWVQYNKERLSDEGRPKMLDITYLYPDEFIGNTRGRDPRRDNIDSITDFGGTEIFIRNDIPPSWWTSFDDTYIVFDAYDNEVDTTLQSSKSQCYYDIDPQFQLVDDFTPILPVDAFSELLARVKRTAWSELRQIRNNVQERKVRDNQSRMSRKQWRAQGGVRFDGYGRNRYRISNTRNWKFDKNTGSNT